MGINPAMNHDEDINVLDTKYCCVSRVGGCLQCRLDSATAPYTASEMACHDWKYLGDPQ